MAGRAGCVVLLGLESMASRSRYMKYGVAVASPRAAMRSIFVVRLEIAGSFSGPVLTGFKYLALLGLIRDPNAEPTARAPAFNCSQRDMARVIRWWAV